MGRPRKSANDTFFDTFADWHVDDQAASLRIMTELHRQKVRESRRSQQPHDIAKVIDPRRNAAHREGCPECGSLDIQVTPFDFGDGDRGERGVCRACRFESDISDFPAPQTQEVSQ